MSDGGEGYLTASALEAVVGSLDGPEFAMVEVEVRGKYGSVRRSPARAVGLAMGDADVETIVVYAEEAGGE